MRRVVDASVVLKWFREEEGTAAALALRAACEEGDVDVVVPHLLGPEVLNVAARRWRWPGDALVGLVEALDRLPLRVQDPALVHVARWAAAGLTAYDATYVALAEATGCRVVTTDEQMLEVAPALTARLA